MKKNSLDLLMQLLTTQKNEQKAFHSIEKGDRIGVENDVLIDIERMIKEKILKQHEENYPIWQAPDGRWKTKVPDGSRYGKLVAKTSRENLENYIVEFYKEIRADKKKPCMRSVFPEWLAFKAKETSMANANSIQARWNRYFANTTIVDVPFDELTTGALKSWCVDVIAEMHLTKRQFKDLKSIMNMIFDFAVSFDLIQINLSRQVRGFGENIFQQEAKKADYEIVYNQEVKKSLIEDALSQFGKTHNTAYLAVCLNFSLGLRVGELVALRTSHINADGTICICQEEVKDYYTDEDGKIRRNGYKIVNHTKTLSGERVLCLTPMAKKYIDMALTYNKEHGLKDEDFIFLNKEGHRIHDHAVNNILRRLNGVRNEKDAFIIEDKPSGNHSIRKTVISELHDSQKFSDDTIKTFAGHKDISTTQKCYIHQIRGITEFADAFTEVLG